MFGFGKKKEKAEQKTATIELSPEQKAELNQVIALKQQELAQAEESLQAVLYEELGLAYEELGETDQAVSALEKSLQLKKSAGRGYKTLLKLYNQKRAAAAKANDGQTLQYYLEKIDQMMQISKDVTRGIK